MYKHIKSVLIIFMLVLPLTLIQSSEGGSNDKEHNDETGSRQLTNSPWPMFRHDAKHTGLSPYDASGNIGRMKWKYQSDGPILSSPTVDSKGTIYFSSLDNYFYAFNKDGSLKWNYQVEACITASPAIDVNGIIYVGLALPDPGPSYFYAFYENGSVKWKVNIGSMFTSSPAIDENGVIYVGSFDKYLRAIYPNGTIKWEFKTEDAIWTSPAIGDDGTIYIGVEDGQLYAVKPDGTLKWTGSLSGHPASSPAIDSNGNIIYIVGYNLLIFEPDGTIKSETRLESYSSASPALGSDGTIYVSADFLYAYDSSGKLKWKSDTSIDLGASPIVDSKGIIYVASYDGNLYSFKSDGKLRWKFYVGLEVHSSPAIDSDGTIYIGSTDGTFYAIGSKTPTGKDPPSPPRNLDSNVDEGYVELFWDYPVEYLASDVTDYRIYRSINDGPANLLTTQMVNYTSFLDRSVSNDVTYSYYITAENPNGESDSSNKITVTPVKNVNKAIWPMSGYDRWHSAHSIYDTSYNTGEIKWSYSLNVWGLIPSIGADGTLYVSASGHLLALTPDGTVKWKYTFSLDDQDPITVPAIDDEGNIYVGIEDEGLWSFNSSGKIRWKSSIEKSNSIQDPVIGPKGLVYVAITNKLYTIHPNNGTIKWSYETSEWIDYPPSIAADGTIYLSSSDLILNAINPDGSLKWSKRFWGEIDQIAIGLDGTLYTSPYGLTALKPDGSIRWQVDIRGYYGRFSDFAIGYDGTIYFGAHDDDDGSDYLYAVQPDDGSIKWRYVADDWVGTTLIGGDGLIFTSIGSDLVALYPNGSLKWNITISGVRISLGSIGKDGTIYLYANRHVYAVGRNSTIPTPPTNMVLSARFGFVDISWDEPVDTGVGVENYKIFKKQAQTDWDLIAIVPGDEMTFKDKDVTIGEEYYYHIRAVNDFGESDQKGTILNVTVNEIEEPNEPSTELTLLEKIGTISILLIILGILLLALGIFFRHPKKTKKTNVKKEKK